MDRKGYGFGIGAALAAIIVVCVGLGLYIGAVGLPQQHERAGQNTQTEQGQDKAAPKAALPHVPKGKDYNPSCELGEDNRDSDLCAQWKAADAAYESSVWTRRASIAAVIATLVGAFTLVAASFAAWYARQAARHTETGAKAAKDSVNVSRETANLQSRPWLAISAEPGSDIVINERGMFFTV